MGYTHYWTQTRDLTAEEWKDAQEHIAAILKDVQHIQGIPLGNASGDPGSAPEFTPKCIMFNGVGDDAHETCRIVRKREKTWEGGRLGWDFTKTARKPYDLAVTAVLSYLSTVVETHSVSSDGDGSDWLAGVEEARRAIPRFANVLDIPMQIMQNDRWRMPWVNCTAKGYDIRFCIDGRGYILHKGQSYCFETHLALAQFLKRTQVATFARGGSLSWGGYGRVEENIWNASGSFDKARHDRIARTQLKVLKPLFPVDPACAQQPPAFARPNEMPPPEAPAFYSFSELLASVGG